MPDAIEKLFSDMYDRLETAGRPKPDPAAPGQPEERRDPYSQVWKHILEDLQQPDEPAPLPQAG